MLDPIRKSDWSAQMAAHLFQRAGFGEAPPAIAAAAQQSPEAVVDSLLRFPLSTDPIQPPSWLVPGADARPDRRALKALDESERRERRRTWRRAERGKLMELRAWWLYRMRYSRAPLQEKLTLFWHGHFATSARKARSSYALYQQNQTFRQMAHGNWRDLITAVARDPAMLIYLDNARSNKKAPNENFARELMELFTLGEGRYTEEDIQEAARAFTGWTLHREKFSFVYRKRMHDNGTKRFFGKAGRFEGTDIVDIIVSQPTSAAFIVDKLWRFFAYDPPDRSVLRSLTGTLRNGGHELKPVLREMFLSRAFYSKAALRTQIKSPVQWLVGMARALEAPLPDGKRCHAALRLLGQELFAPPNVKGWDGGESWITTATLLHRYNFSGAFVGVAGTGGPGIGPSLDIDRLLPVESRTTKEAALHHLEQRLFQAPIRAQDTEAFMNVCSEWGEPARWTDKQVRTLLHAMMSSPQFQLC